MPRRERKSDPVNDPEKAHLNIQTSPSHTDTMPKLKTNTHLILLCLLIIFHWFRLASSSINLFSCCREIASLFGTLDVFVICLFKSRTISRQLRFNAILVELNMMTIFLNNNNFLIPSSGALTLFSNRPSRRRTDE